MQLVKLRKLLRHAYVNSNYYRKLFEEHDFDPENLQSVSDLTRLPILEKECVQRNRDSILSRKVDKKRLNVHYTTGSTGMPLKLFGDDISESYSRALRYRSYIENGLRPGNVVVEISSPKNEGFQGYAVQKLGLFRRYKFSALTNYNDLFERINKIKPDVIECYPSVLNLITQSCKKDNLTFRPKVIFSFAELLLPNWRKNIVNFFDCDVRDVYGSVEFHRLAWECEKHEGYHLDIDAHLIEFVDKKDNPVETGEGIIIVTGLYNYAFPLIRYRIGEIAQLKQEPCSCGRTLPLVDLIQGREDDYIKLPSGRMISPLAVNFLDTVQGIKEYLTIQVERNLIKVQAIKNNEFNESTIDSIKKYMREGCLGEEIEIEVELVPEIKRQPGKIRTVISLVK